MEQLLLDLHIAEAYSTMTPTTDTAKLAQHEKDIDSLALYYKEILAHHKVSFDEFEKSMSWYSDHPDLLDSVYVKVQPKLDSMLSKKNP